ncbi:hypothetical protein Kpho02_76470 [Kitasatospora phosalacinea]|uniref:Uncharacterized protein n=1 Tax=Kitasatospora phosalacinea TaxID=2065 RepID=A0A9W6V7L0_9ACTN|nr:hypothetical protein Kpho02_76470 [Kitasatospora phosalacinea]
MIGNEFQSHPDRVTFVHVGMAAAVEWRFLGSLAVPGPLGSAPDRPGRRGPGFVSEARGNWDAPAVRRCETGRRDAT